MTTGFVKTALIVALAALVLSSAARAEGLALPGNDVSAESQKPTLVTAETVAMTWYRLAGQTPDFDAWALLTDDVKNAPEFDRQAAQGRKAAEMLQNFGLVVPGDQIIADLPVTLSDYSIKNKGYLIENFSTATFLKFSHNGQNFGVVPRALMDHQWIAAADLPAKEIDDLRRAGKNGRDAVLTLFLLPQSASPKPVVIDSADWRVLSADIIGMAFFDPAGRLVWSQKQAQQGLTADQKQQKNDLMQLYR